MDGRSGWACCLARAYGVAQTALLPLQRGRKSQRHLATRIHSPMAGAGNSTSSAGDPMAIVASAAGRASPMAGQSYGMGKRREQAETW
jgi:hypothetical protein